jgi:DNA-damage-inducible protein D
MTQLPANQSISPFNQIRHEDAQGEYCLARELAMILDYALWQNFERVIKKAMAACEGSGQNISANFIDVNKVTAAGKHGNYPVHDYRLTRYACYLIAQNADSSKEIVALAQTYFAMMTREQEELLALMHEVGDDNPFTEIAQRIIRRYEAGRTVRGWLTSGRL